MKSASQIDTMNVTPEQIGRCYKVFGTDGKAFYQVESERDSQVEYQVKWTREHGFTCTCEAGQRGFAQCKDGYCKHVRWSVACAKEEREALKELESTLYVQPVAVATNVDAETLQRVLNAKPAKVACRAQTTTKAFSLLR